jgi:hypothetical protein
MVLSISTLFSHANLSPSPGQEIGGRQNGANFRYTVLSSIAYMDQPLSNCAIGDGPALTVIGPPISNPSIKFDFQG